MNRLLAVLLPGVLLLPLPAPLAAQETEPDPCAIAVNCRVVGPLRVEDPHGQVQTIEMGMTLPFVVEGNVLLAPGDAVVVLLAEEGGELVPTLARTGAAAREGSLATGEMRIELSQIERGNVTLVVTSAYPEALEYGAVKVSLATGPERTSVCTLMPGVAVFEVWQEPIYQMALWGWRPAEGYACSVVDFGGPDQLQQTGGEPEGA